MSVVESCTVSWKNWGSPRSVGKRRLGMHRPSTLMDFLPLDLLSQMFVLLSNRKQIHSVDVQVVDNT